MNIRILKNYTACYSTQPGFGAELAKSINLLDLDLLGSSGFKEFRGSREAKVAREARESRGSNGSIRILKI